jgi:IS5 family transposase
MAKRTGGALGPAELPPLVGLALADPVPDHSTLSRFRSALVRRGLSERLLAELNRQLDARGLMVKSGTLIDASLVAADCRRPKKGEPVEGRSDPAASWNAMPEKPLFGDKMHLAVDQGSGLVRRRFSRQAMSRTRCRSWLWSKVTSRRCTLIGAMMAGGTARSWPCAASPTASWPAATASGRLLPKATPATGRSRRSGRRSSASFAIMNRHYGYARVRYRSLVKNALQLQLLALAMNLRRALALTT